MKKYLFIIFTLLSIQLSTAQTITPLGLGTRGSFGNFHDGEIRALFVDDSTNNLYVGGNFPYMDGVLSYGLARWDGTNWHQMGSGIIDINQTPPGTNGAIQDIIKYKSEIYVCGTFQKINSQPINTIAKWDGTNFVSIGNFVTSGNGSSYAIGSEMHVLNEELYLVGRFDSINSVAVNNIAKWDGSTWTSLSGGFGLGCDNYQVNSITDFEGDLYVGGNLNCNQVERIYKYNGIQWAQAGPDITGDSWVNKLYVFKNQLYIGGYFFAAAGNADNCFMIYDKLANSFLPTAGGTLPSNLKEMYAYQDNLYVVGQLDYSGNQLNGRTAKWNGTAWQNSNMILISNSQTPPMPGGGVGTAFEMVEYQNKLVVAGSINGINNVTAYGIAMVDFTVGLPTKQNDKNLTIFPNPTNNLLNIQIKKGLQEGSVKLYNQLGQVVYSQTKGVFKNIDVSTFAKGVYFAEVRQEDKVMRQKVVVE